MNTKFNSIVIFLFLFCFNGISQEINFPTDSIFKQKVKDINDLIQVQFYDQAIDDLKKLALSVNTESEKGYCYWLLYYTYSSQGDVKATSKKYTEAILLYDSALKYIQINNKFLNEIKFLPFETYTSRGICYSRLKDFKTAIFDYNNAINLNPEHGLAYFNRGVAFHNLGNIEKACSDYLEADRYNYPVESRLIEGCRSLR